MKQRLKQTKNGECMRVLMAAALALGVAGTALGQEAAKAGSKLLLDANGKVHSPGTISKPATGGRMFFVDSESGSDKNSGFAERTPWKSLERVNAEVFQPGDLILFKAGSTWSGQLRPKGSGAEGKPIRIDCYGTGPLPVIDQGELSGNVVELVDQEYWEISHLEVSGGREKPDERAGGIHVKASGAGRVLKHIVIRDCLIRNILGSIRYYDSCAIWVGVPGWDDDRGLTTGFDGVLVENNIVRNADRCGILIWTCAGPGPKSRFKKGLIPSKNVIVRGNSLYDIGGDAILVIGTIKPLVEYNLVYRSNKTCGNVPANHWGEKYNPSSAGIWFHHCLEGVIQFNAVYDSNKHRFNNDGMSYDFDFNCHRCLLQYNYSCNNAGGFLLIMQTATENIVRYNLSVNDQNHVLFLVGRTNEGNQVYNNTFYLDNGSAYLVSQGGMLKNNIFMASGKASYALDAKKGPGKFLNNCFAGNWEQQPEDPQKVVKSPLLVAPEKASLENPKGFQLRRDSPCIGSAAPIVDHGGRDFFGNPLFGQGPKCVGAHEIP